MNQRPIITDEQLRDLRDGLLTGAERRLVEIQIEVDDEVAARFEAVRAELVAMRASVPSADFSKNIMAQLAAEGMVKQPVAARRTDWVIRAALGFAGLLFAASLVVLWKNWAGIAPGFELPPVDFYINWGQILNSPVFRWSIWVGCLLPAVLLLDRNLSRGPAFRA